MTEDTPKRLVANDRTDRFAGLPFRGEFGAARPTALDALPLPPAPMPARLETRPLKAWRYIGVFGPELMLCAATVRIGRARQSFWAAWDREGGRLHERTWLSKGGVQLSYGRALVSDGAARIDIVLAESDGVETVCPDGAGYGWTRKQGGVPATGTVVLGDGRARPIAATAIIDDTAAYYRRHTRWRWCAGVGIAVDGRPVAWNLVEGVNDPPHHSERTLWVDGEPCEVPPVSIDPALDRVGDLRFAAEATRAHAQNLLVLRSRYRQPFGTFSGTLPGGPRLAAGYGVMEDHDVFW